MLLKIRPIIKHAVRSFYDVVRLVNPTKPRACDKTNFLGGLMTHIIFLVHNGGTCCQSTHASSRTIKKLCLPVLENAMLFGETS